MELHPRTMPPASRSVDAQPIHPRPVRRPARRRGPRTLEQIPVWAEPIDRSDESGEATEGPSGLDALLAGLNADQLRAVTHGEGPLLVVAGAGTGKTQVVTRRIAWLIATRRARPSEILALTFTDKAAAEMQVRVDQLVPYGYTDTAISTFHAFGDRLIREYALELGLAPDVRVLSRPDVVIFLRERLFDLDLDHYRPLGDPTRFLGALATHFSRLKDEDVDPAAYLAHANREVGEAALIAELAEERDAVDDAGEAAASAVEAAGRQLELARAYARYQALLSAEGFIDFGDQVALAVRLLRESPAARRDVRRRFRYILVDEFQDTNRAQAELVELIAEPHRNVTVVGDDDQSIYRFRGAAMSNIVEFRDHPRRPRVVVLRRNYRSRAGILAASHRLIRFNDPDRLEVQARIDKRLRAQRPEPPVGRRPAAIRHEAFATAAEEADWVTREIAVRVATGGAPRDHAILVRSNAEADAILRSLNVAGLPWRFSGSSGLYARPEVRLLLAFLRAVADLGSSVDVYALAASDVYGLGGEDLTEIVASARRRNRTVWTVLEELDRQPGILRLAPASRAAVGRLVRDLRHYTELAHARPAGEVLYAFLKGSGLLARLAATDGARSEEALQNIARFFDIVRGRSALLADDRCSFVAGHLRTLIEAGDDPPTAELDGDAEAVSVLTVHKAKGLEFPTVFLVGLVDGRFPSTSRRDPLAIPAALVAGPRAEGDAHLREERRLFYVGMTRARDELILTHAADYGGRTARRVSPFVLEALDLASADAGRTRRAHPAERLAAFSPPGVAAEPARRPTDEPLSLSFYQIDDYLTCPLRYRYGHVVRVPVAPHHSIVYGSALHRAVQEFHRRQGRGEIMTEADLEAAFLAAWTNEGFLTREHEEARLAAGRAALRRFRDEQLRPGTVVPRYVERDFSFSLGGDRIRGRWDRVDIEPIDDEAVTPGQAAGEEASGDAGGSPSADVVEPTLPLLPREWVTITDYKSSDVRDPAKARQRARDSLQLTIYAMGYEAMTGRLPDAVQLHFLETGVIGRAVVDEKRLAKARVRIARAADGIRARAFEPTPDVIACTYCPFRDICPSSAVR
jgi:DNA helicase II / ATP-dependent DNA helicase PcrA